MANIGNELRSYFRDRGVTQQSIANELHVSNAYINAIFTGKKSIGKSTARKLSELYGNRKRLYQEHSVTARAQLPIYTLIIIIE